VLVSRGCRSHDDWMRRSPSARGIAAGVAWRGGLCRGYHMACHVTGAPFSLCSCYASRHG
jgi:hypothetical protein